MSTPMYKCMKSSRLKSIKKCTVTFSLPCVFMYCQFRIIPDNYSTTRARNIHVKFARHVDCLASPDWRSGSLRRDYMGVLLPPQVTQNILHISRRDFFSALFQKYFWHLHYRYQTKKNIKY